MTLLYKSHPVCTIGYEDVCVSEFCTTLSSVYPPSPQPLYTPLPIKLALPQLLTVSSIHKHPSRLLSPCRLPVRRRCENDVTSPEFVVVCLVKLKCVGIFFGFHQKRDTLHHLARLALHKHLVRAPQEDLVSDDDCVMECRVRGEVENLFQPGGVGEGAVEEVPCWSELDILCLVFRLCC